MDFETRCIRRSFESRICLTKLVNIDQGLSHSRVEVHNLFGIGTLDEKLLVFKDVDVDVMQVILGIKAHQILHVFVKKKLGGFNLQD